MAVRASAVAPSPRILTEIWFPADRRRSPSPAHQPFPEASIFRARFPALSYS